MKWTKSPQRQGGGRLAALALALAGLLMVPASAGAARSVYLNGVKIDGVTNQEFTGAKVRIDSTGNVHIEAKGYEVKKIGTSGAGDEEAAAGPPVSETYFLVATENKPGKVQWDVDVFVGGRKVASVTWDGGQVVKDISQFLVQGDNEIRFRATRNLSAGRKSFSPGDKLTVMIGSGSKQGNNVVIRKPLASFVRNAAEDEPTEKTMTVQAR